MIFIVAMSAHAGSDQGGGGHLIVDANGNLIPLDQYEGIALSKFFKLEEVCPSGLKEIEISKSPQLAQAYLSSLDKTSVLSKDKSYRLAEMQLQKALDKMKWYTCDQDLPLIVDHRFKEGVLTSKLVQIAMQTSAGEVVFSSPVLNKLAKQKNGHEVLEATVLHEIALNAWGNQQISREELAKIVRGLIDQNEGLLQQLKNSYNYIFSEIKLECKSCGISNYILDIHLENGEVFSIDKYNDNRWAVTTNRESIYLEINKKILTKQVKYDVKRKPLNTESVSRGVTDFDYYTFESQISKICMRDIMIENVMYKRKNLPESYYTMPTHVGLSLQVFNPGYSFYNGVVNASRYPFNLGKLDNVPLVHKGKYSGQLEESVCLDMAFMDQ